DVENARRRGARQGNLLAGAQHQRPERERVETIASGLRVDVGELDRSTWSAGGSVRLQRILRAAPFVANERIGAAGATTVSERRQSPCAIGELRWMCGLRRP